jgi:hypothetical protein
MFISLCVIFCTRCTFSCHIVLSSADSLHIRGNVRENDTMEQAEVYLTLAGTLLKNLHFAKL